MQKHDTGKGGADGGDRAESGHFGHADDAGAVVDQHIGGDRAEHAQSQNGEGELGVGKGLYIGRQIALELYQRDQRKGDRAAADQGVGALKGGKIIAGAAIDRFIGTAGKAVQQQKDDTQYADRAKRIARQRDEYHAGDGEQGKERLRPGGVLLEKDHRQGDCRDGGGGHENAGDGGVGIIEAVTLKEETAQLAEA